MPFYALPACFQHFCSDPGSVLAFSVFELFDCLAHFFLREWWYLVWLCLGLRVLAAGAVTMRRKSVVGVFFLVELFVECCENIGDALSVGLVVAVLPGHRWYHVSVLRHFDARQLPEAFELDNDVLDLFLPSSPF